VKSADHAPSPSRPELRELAAERFRASAEVPTAFFDANAERIAAACRDLARAFHDGHRLLVFGAGAQWSDALHVSVEFVHPVIVGKRALPALALDGDGLAQLRVLAEPGDVLLALATTEAEPARTVLAAARERGLLTLALVGGPEQEWWADHLFAVPSADPWVVQETQETLYHVLWELVHVFLELPESLP
jgi:D-sedoheptulose 7-phosphate isomerase